MSRRPDRVPRSGRAVAAVAIAATLLSQAALAQEP
jgi:hypothetical protein